MNVKSAVFEFEFVRSVNFALLIIGECLSQGAKQEKQRRQALLAVDYLVVVLFACG